VEVSNDRIVDFHEKPVLNHVVSMGVYGVSRRALDFIPAAGPFGFDQLMVKLLAEGEQIDTVQHHGFWLDIGRPDDYAQASEEFARDIGRFL
jgi:NDP-sugar pyrophosphorylase family protein